MWTLARWNNFYNIVETMDCHETEEEARETLQIWINDEYYNDNISSFSEEYDEDLGAIVITVDNEEYYIWED